MSSLQGTKFWLHSCPTWSLVTILTKLSQVKCGQTFCDNPQAFTLNLMFIGLCINVIVEELKTKLMSLVILFYFLCTQHVSDINISIIRSLRLCCWITTSVVLFLVHCVLAIWCGWIWVVSVLQAEAQLFGLQHGHYSNPVTPNRQHTTNREQNDGCGNSTAQLQAPVDGYINVRNMLST